MKRATFSDSAVLRSPIRQMITSVAAGAGIAFTIRMGGTAVAYISHLLFARWMGVGDYGSYIYALAWAKLLALLCGLGLITGVLRFIPEYLAALEYGRIRGIVRRSQQLTFLSGIVLAAIGATLVFAIKPQTVDMKTLIGGMLLVPFIALTTLQAEIILGTRKIFLARFPQLVVHPASCLVAAFILFKKLESLNSLSALAAYTIASFFLLSVQIYALRLVFSKEILKALPVYSTRKWLRISFPLLLIAGFQLIFTRADIIVIGIVKGDEATGIYNVAAQTATLAVLVFGAVNTAVGPMISTLHTKGDHLALQKLVRASANWMFWPSFGVMLSFLLWGKSILSLFGADFIAGWVPLCLLALGHTVRTIVGPATYLLSLTGHQDISARVFGGTAALNIILNTVMVPLWGIVGAALATMFSMLVWSIWLHAAIKEYLGINAFVFSRA